MSIPLTDCKIKEKRNNLIYSAINILEKEGMENLTLRNLAKMSGVSRTTPYLYFKDKEDLINAIRVTGLNNVIEKCESALGGHDHYMDRLRIIGDTYVEFAIEHPELYQLIFISDLESKATSDELQNLIQKYKELTETPMQAAYDDGVTLLPPDRLNNILWSALHGMIILNRAGLLGDKSKFSALRADMEQVLATGFIAKTGQNSQT